MKTATTKQDQLRALREAATKTKTTPRAGSVSKTLKETGSSGAAVDTEAAKPVTVAPGFRRMQERLGPDRAEKLRQETLAGQSSALAETVKHSVATKEDTVKTSTKKRPAKTAAKVPPKTGTAAKSKSQIAEDLLTSKVGATRAELAEATGWKHVNLVVAAERAKKKLVELAGGRFRLVQKR